ncbi:Voltage-gated Ion Channel (VIC) Superfamily [Achlya hypogyna]|uniref:Calcium-channel protein CCH1 n=1 Tax=Achlya hypogyna TaxID=1202772 RepID=A0A1V9YEW2_ACHHY|nr:Voltage-gated Ion Channel (VIC) Superfamily [Achlya hypogyna]
MPDAPSTWNHTVGTVVKQTITGRSPAPQEHENIARKASRMLCNAELKKHVWGQVHTTRIDKLKVLQAEREERRKSVLVANSTPPIAEGHEGDDPPFQRPVIKPRSQLPEKHLSNIAFKSLRTPHAKPKPQPSEMLESPRHSTSKPLTLPTFEVRARRFSRRVLRHKHTNNVIAGVVLFDTVVMALDYSGSVALGALDFLCTLFFAAELALRIALHGAFRGHRPFFRTKMSVVHALLTVACLLSHCVLGLGTLSQWRVVRGLKSYRCFTAVRGIKRILAAITKAVPLLANVGVLAFFFLLMFSIIGLEAFSSVYDGQCALSSTPNITLEPPDDRFMYPANGCPAGFVCVSVDSGEKSQFHSFQNGFASFLLVFQVMVLDGWVDSIMDPSIQTTSEVAVVFFILVIMLLVFLVLNLFVAVITTAFMGHGEVNLENLTGDTTGATGAPLDMRKMDKEDEEQHLYMVLGTTMAVEQAAEQQQAPPDPFKVAPLALPDESDRRSSYATTEGELTRRMFSSTTLPVETTMSFVSSRDLFHPLDTSCEAVFLAALEDLPGRSGQLRRFILSDGFADFVMLCIIANTIALMLEYPNMGDWWQNFFDDLEFAFSFVFAIEILLKFYAYQSLHLYLCAYERWLDAIVVAASLSISIVKYYNGGHLNNLSWMDNVSILRTLRIGRLMWRWKGTRKLIESVLKSSRAMYNLFVFLVLFIVVHSVIAMQLFAGEPDMPRENFQSFFFAFVTMFQVLSGDKWAEIMESVLERDSLFFAPYFIGFVFFGQFVVLNLFIAVILENFEISEEEAYQLQLERVLAIPKELQMFEKLEEVGVRAFYANNDMRQLDNVQDIKARRFLGFSERHIPATASATATAHLVSLDKIVPWVDQVLASTSFKYFIILTIVLSCVGLALDDPVVLSDLTPAELAAYTTKSNVLSVINAFALAVFVVEFVLKVMSQGFGFRYLLLKLCSWYESQYYRSRYESNSRKTSPTTKKHYIEDPWNRLDFFLLVVAVLDQIISFNATKGRSSSFVKVLRVGRVLRPLRLFNQDGDMKLIMTSFAAALPAVFDVLVFCCGVFIIFGIAGRTLFALKMYSCNDKSVLNRTQCTGFFDGQPLPSSSTPVLMPRVWVPYRARFDTLASSLIVLMELSSVKTTHYSDATDVLQWVDTAEFAMDIVGIDEQPELNNGAIYIVYFIGVVFVGGFFLIRLFVGVLVEQFQRNNGTQILTPSQKCWVELERHMLLLKPRFSAPEPANAYRQRAFHLAKSTKFEHFMSSIIVFNLLFMLLNTAKAPQMWRNTFDSVDKLFVAMYTCEFAIKVLAFGRHVFRDSWHLFDAILLIGSFVSYLPGTSIHQISQIGRIFRVMRVMKFVKVSKGVRTVFRTFRASLASIGNVVLLLVLLLYIFAILGRQLFGTTKYGPQLNQTQNFESFGNALLTLFALIAGGEWHLLMTDCMVEGAECATIGSDTDCGQYYAAWMYFLVFVIAIVYIFLNLFIAVILENFRSCYVKDISPVTLEDFEGYQEVFEKYDKDHKGVLPLYMLGRFLHDLPPNLRVATTGNRMAYLHLRFEIEQVMLAPTTPQSIPFFNALLRTVCIHHMGIRALSYEQQRDRVKQIFVIKEKVAGMLVRAMLHGVLERTRLRSVRPHTHYAGLAAATT